MPSQERPEHAPAVRLVLALVPTTRVRLLWSLVAVLEGDLEDPDPTHDCYPRMVDTCAELLCGAGIPIDTEPDGVDRLARARFHVAFDRRTKHALLSLPTWIVNDESSAPTLLHLIITPADAATKRMVASIERELGADTAEELRHDAFHEFLERQRKRLTRRLFQYKGPGGLYRLLQHSFFGKSESDAHGQQTRTGPRLYLERLFERLEIERDMLPADGDAPDAGSDVKTARNDESIELDAARWRVELEVLRRFVSAVPPKSRSRTEDGVRQLALSLHAAMDGAQQCEPWVLPPSGLNASELIQHDGRPNVMTWTERVREYGRPFAAATLLDVLDDKRMAALRRSLDDAAEDHLRVPDLRAWLVAALTEHHPPNKRYGHADNQLRAVQQWLRECFALYDCAPASHPLLALYLGNVDLDQ